MQGKKEEPKIQTDIFSLVSRGDLKTLKKLFSKAAFPRLSPAEISLVNENGLNAFHLAVTLSREDIVTFFLSQGIDVNARTIASKTEGARTKGGETALMLAVVAGSVSIVRALLKANALPSERRPHDKMTALSFACRRQNNDIVQSLLARGADPENVASDGTFPLWDACMRGDIECVRLLLEAKAPVDMKSGNGRTCLMLACKMGHSRLVEILLGRSADPNVFCPKQRTALWFALKGNLPAVTVELLIKRKAANFVRPSDGMTPMLLAVKQGKIAEVKAMIDAGFSLDECSKDGSTALVFACERGDEKMASLLLRGKASPYVSAPGGEPLILVVLEKRFASLALFLIRHHLDFWSPCPATGDTPLHRATRYGMKNVVEAILKSSKKVDVNALNYAGKRPVDEAVSQDLINLFKRKGSNIEKKERRRVSSPIENGIVVESIQNKASTVESKGIDSSKMSSWSIEQVCEYFTRLGADNFALNQIRKEQIEGGVLLKMTKKDIQEVLGVPDRIWAAHEETVNPKAALVSATTILEPTLNRSKQAVTSRSSGSAKIFSETMLMEAPNVKARSISVGSGGFKKDESDRFLLSLNYEGVVLQSFVTNSGQASVYKGLYKGLGNMEVAVKVFLNEESEGFEGETQALLSLQHDNIIRVCAFFTLPRLAIVTQWISGGPLHEWLERQRVERLDGCVWDDSRLQTAVGIIKGLEYLHSKGVVHRDLKSPNVMLDPGSNRAILIDFGMAKLGLSRSKRESLQSRRRLGSLFWMSPEMIERQSYSYASDIYAFGIVLWELLSSRLPYADFASEFQLQKAVVEGSRPLLHDDWPANIVKVAVRCWNSDPSLRPNASEVLLSLSSQKKQAVKYKKKKRGSRMSLTE